MALAAFDAEVDVIGPRGQRTIPVGRLHLEPDVTPQRETVLAADELILRIRVSTTSLGRASTYHKIRNGESYAFALDLGRRGDRPIGSSVRDACIALGGVATKP